MEHKEFALMLLDLMLPGITGEEVLGEVREKTGMPDILHYKKLEILAIWGKWRVIWECSFCFIPHLPR